MYIMILDAADFRHEIYQCKYCDGASLGFESASPDGPFFKFPPTIGAAGNADILFVGINPRISNTNKNLHSELTHNIQAFDELAGNRYNGQEYIEAERHYRNHATIVKDLFQGQSFEAAAAVTELFFCATKKTNKLLVESCPCANLFLEKTILHVRPKVIIPVGKIVLRYFQKCFGKDKEVFKIKIEDYHSWVVPMSHPAAWGQGRKWETGWTIKNTRLALNGLLPSYETLNSPSSVPLPIVETMNLRVGSTPGQTACQPVTTYKHESLCFCADIIEPLSETDHFSIGTPLGIFQMSKADFYKDFKNVVQSNSYNDGRRIYRYLKVPEKAFKHLLADGSTNELILFFLRNHDCCDSYYCTTCGGRSFFYKKLCSTIEANDLARCLKSLSLSDLRKLEGYDKEGMVITALEYLDDLEKPDVLKAWEDTIIRDPDFASMLVYRLKKLSDIALPSTRRAVLSSLQNRIVFDMKLRNGLRSFYELKEFPNCKAVCDEEYQYDEYFYKRERLAIKQREDYLNGLSVLPFDERMKKICSDSSIESADIREEWHKIPEDEMVAVPRDTLHTLIGIIEQSKHSHYLSDLRQRLYDQRHKLRMERMDALRSSLQGISPEDQLARLISSKEIPIEDYPVELSEAATKDFIDSLKPEDRDRFDTFLTLTPLRVWKKVKTSLQPIIGQN